MKLADFSEHWLFFTLLVAGPAGVNVAIWVLQSGLGNMWVGAAWGGSVFGIVLAVLYVCGLLIHARR